MQDDRNLFGDVRVVLCMRQESTNPARRSAAYFYLTLLAIATIVIAIRWQLGVLFEKDTIGWVMTPIVVFGLSVGFLAAATHIDVSNVNGKWPGRQIRLTRIDPCQLGVCNFKLSFISGSFNTYDLFYKSALQVRIYDGQILVRTLISLPGRYLEAIPGEAIEKVGLSEYRTLFSTRKAMRIDYIGDEGSEFLFMLLRKPDQVLNAMQEYVLSPDCKSVTST